MHKAPVALRDLNLNRLSISRKQRGRQMEKSMVGRFGGV
jgi:hypothetical protein